MTLCLPTCVLRAASEREVGDLINKWSTEPASPPPRACLYFYYYCRVWCGSLLLAASMHFHAEEEISRARARACVFALRQGVSGLGGVARRPPSPCTGCSLRSRWFHWLIATCRNGIAIQISVVVSLLRVTTRSRVQCAIWLLSGLGKINHYRVIRLIQICNQIGIIYDKCLSHDTYTKLAISTATIFLLWNFLSFNI